MLAEAIGLGARFRPAVAAYWARLQQRDGFGRAVAAEQRAAAAASITELTLPKAV